MSLRTFSSGGGVQSTAALVLSAQGKIDFPVHLFSNVGDDSEHPATLAYVRDVIRPYAKANGIEFVTLQRIRSRAEWCAGSNVVATDADLVDGEWRCPSCGAIVHATQDPGPEGDWTDVWNIPKHKPAETLYGRLVKEGSRSLPIPVRMDNGAPGTRSCTLDFKLRVIEKWLKEAGATEDNPATVGIGFSTDEIQRVGKARHREWERVTYPLIDLGLSRNDCLRLVAKAGLPQPPKSSCWFCPMHRPAVWSEMRRDEPDLFKRSVELEALLNERRDVLGKDHVYFTRFAKPLDQAIGEAQTPLFEGEGPAGEFEECDEGVCFT